MVNTSKNNTIRFSYLVNILLLLFIGAIYITPILNNNIFNNMSIVVIFLLFFVWMGSAYKLGRNKMGLHENKYWIYLLCWEAFGVILGRGDLNLFAIFALIPLFLVPVLGLFAIQFYNYAEKIFTCALLFLIVIANVIYNDVVGQTMQEVYKMLVDSDVSKDYNLGSTTFVAFCLFFFPICFLLLYIKKHYVLKLLSCAAIAATGYFFFVISPRATATLLFLVILFFYLFNSDKEFNKRNVSRFFLKIIFLIFVLYFLYDILFSFLINYLFADNQDMINRLDDLKGLNSGKADDEGSLSLRIKLAKLSLSTWSDNIINFFIGIGEITPVGLDATYEKYAKTGIGHHSQFIDQLARYGIIGGILLYKALKHTFSCFVNSIHQIKPKNMLALTFFVYVLYSFLNNSFNWDIMFIVFVFLPLTADIVSETIEKNN